MPNPQQDRDYSSTQEQLAYLKGRSSVILERLSQAIESLEATRAELSRIADLISQGEAILEMDNSPAPPPAGVEGDGDGGPLD